MLSIVTINFNNREGLIRTLQSLYEQQSTSFELVIIDGGSTDGSVEVIDRYKQFFSKIYTVSEPDLGIYDAMNKGAALCNNDFVSFLNSGDVFISSDYLDSVVDFIVLSRPTIGFYSDIIITNSTGELDRIWRSREFSSVLFYVFGVVPPHPSTFIRRQILVELKFDLRYNIAADYDFFLRLIRNYGVPNYFNTTAVYMEGGGVSNRSFKSVYLANVEVIKSWMAVFGYMPLWLILLKPLFKVSQKVEGFFKSR